MFFSLKKEWAEMSKTKKAIFIAMLSSGVVMNVAAGFMPFIDSMDLNHFRVLVTSAFIFFVTEKINAQMG